MNDKVAIYIVIPNAYQEYLRNRLIQNNYKSTYIGSHGTLLREGQTTFVVVTDINNINSIKKIIGEVKNDFKKKHDNEPLNSMIYCVPVIDFDII